MAASRTRLCGEPECDGLEAEEGLCLAHVDASRLPTVLADGEIDLAGAVVPPGRLEEIVEALPRKGGRCEIKGSASFDGATFQSTAQFEDVDFHQGASFVSTTFYGDVELARCTFGAGVDFSNATILGDADFGGCSFEHATLKGAAFKGSAHLHSWFQDLFAEDAVFSRYTNLTFLHTAEQAVFHGARFGGRAVLRRASIGTELDLSQAVFDDGVELEGLQVAQLDCVGAQFSRGGDLGTFKARDLADFRDAVFGGPVRMRLQTQSLDLRRTMFSGGATVLVDCAFVAAAGASFHRASTLARTELPAERSDSGRADKFAAPQLGSLEGTDTGNLTVVGLDLRGTSFAGAHNLDRLRLQGDLLLARSPGGRGGRPRRSTIYDEHRLRRAAGATEWAPPVQPRFESEPLNLTEPSSSSATTSLTPQDVAETYRALRKGREDARDAPGASDFYFGEMEMRRRAERDPLLWMYVTLSGYGTGWVRALASYLFVVMLAGLALDREGFTPDLGLARCIIFAVGSTVYVARAPQGHELTALGDAVQLGLRILGPLLLGLTLFALRSRVKR